MSVPEMSVPAVSSPPQRLAHNRLPTWAPWALLVGCLAFAAVLVALLTLIREHPFSITKTLLIGGLIYLPTTYVITRWVEGPRAGLDRFVTTLVTASFLIAMIPLISVSLEVLTHGVARMDAEFFTHSMRNVTGAGGGALHAMVGTLLITLAATVLSVPIGLMTAIYLVEYGRGKVARIITFLVDVMTGIPSIVAGLFAYALFALFFGPGVRMGIAGAVSLTVLMIPVVVRSSEEMLRLVPNELREAAYALGVPTWRTIVKVVLPTSLAGVTTGIVLAIARVIGETAPLLVTAGFTASMNYNLFDGRMQSLPVFVYTQYTNQGNPAFAFIDRAWAAALLLIVIVMALNLFARIIAKKFAPARSR